MILEDTPSLRRVFLGGLVPDRALTYAALGNIASLACGTVTAVLVGTYLSPELQGYYYTFGALIMLQFLMELGLGQAIVYVASHEWSGFSLDAGGGPVSRYTSVARLRSLAWYSLRWYGYGALVLVPLLAFSGYAFFSLSSTSASSISWMWPWISLCVGVGFNFVLAPLFYILQGCNQVVDFWFFRLIQQLVNASAVWAAILLGAGVWSLAIASGAIFIWSVLFLCTRFFKFLVFLFEGKERDHIDWKRELWPLQWKVGLSWTTTQYTPFVFAPMLFHLSGPAVAGQMGMTTVVNAVLLAVSANWLITKGPSLGILVAKGEHQDAQALFLRALSASLLVGCAGGGAIWIGVAMLNFHRIPLASRLLSPTATALYVAGTLASLLTTNLSLYFRAHKTERLEWVSAMTAVFSVTLGFILGDNFGATGVALSYCVVGLFFQIPLSLIVFVRFRAERLNKATCETLVS